MQDRNFNSSIKNTQKFTSRNETFNDIQIINKAYFFPFYAKQSKIK